MHYFVSVKRHNVRQIKKWVFTTSDVIHYNITFLSEDSAAYILREQSVCVSLHKELSIILLYCATVIKLLGKI
jgi:hypothetical protein